MTFRVNVPFTKGTDDLSGFPVEIQTALSSLSLLDNISNQLLVMLLSDTFTPDMYSILSEPNTFLDTPSIKTFHKLLKLFKYLLEFYNVDFLLNVCDLVPGMWYPDSPVLNIMKKYESYIISTVRKTNLTVYLLSYIGCIHAPLNQLQEKFFDIFLPNTMFSNSLLNTNEQLLRSQWLLYLDMKTQVYINSLKTLKRSDTYKENNDLIENNDRHNLLNSIFSKAFANELVLRRTRTTADQTLITRYETEFAQRHNTRKEDLYTYTSLLKLKQDHSEESFIRSVFDYASKNMSLIIWGTKHRNSKSPLYTAESRDFEPQILFATDAKLLFDVLLAVNNSHPRYVTPDLDNHVYDSDLVIDTFHQNTRRHRPNNNVLEHSLSVGTSKDIADAALNVNNSSTTRKNRTKRTWSKMEEDALIEGLKSFGPSWSKILNLYGAGGKYTEILKNRTQVQLKDKARNWKLQCLKNGTPLPSYLLRVTGSIERATKSHRKNHINVHSTSARSNNNNINNHSISQQNTNVTRSLGSQTTTELFGASTNNSNEIGGFDPNLTSGI
ncbi:hypothetical protein Kpol_530p11 [Vanderwaltozyma polyspora DSM 70294]|uniref:Uncharacterized protein n=1 Tax=Vanderwaltozyma polyspora (strain ATCC 22028 / DSM 70294 / BCRC 21397 / CBS 2163 / NBRC 10782 / NRRL Y-8283 / UCD 57-17) TaxID=436907 RepID=A7TKY5_VANPO|nr:uncharacterized protein Kpol_530p11 [Vanderwaltozyma polyspora DSM 70294]EDO17041.1 hypothetical protein Kpol_530p11 [Vanderwaltozyma polyspora DSM 70294]